MPLFLCSKRDGVRMFLVPRTREPPLNIKLNIPTSPPFLKNLIPNSHLYFCPIDLCLANVKVNVCIYFDKLCTSATFQEREQFCRVGGQGGFSSIVVFESNLSLPISPFGAKITVADASFEQYHPQPPSQRMWFIA